MASHPNLYIVRTFDQVNLHECNQGKKQIIYVNSDVLKVTSSHQLRQMKSFWFLFHCNITLFGDKSLRQQLLCVPELFGCLTAHHLLQDATVERWYTQSLEGCFINDKRDIECELQRVFVWQACTFKPCCSSGLKDGPLRRPNVTQQGLTSPPIICQDSKQY